MLLPRLCTLLTAALLLCMLREQLHVARRHSASWIDASREHHRILFVNKQSGNLARDSKSAFELS